MAERHGQKIKTMCVLDALRRYSDEDHPLNAQEICAYLEKNGVSAERKSVYDDISVLCDYGYDIIKTTLPKTGWFLGSRELEAPEVYLLTDAVRSAKFISAKKTRELVKKLNSMLSVHQAASRENGVYFDDRLKCANEELYYNIDSLSRAISLKMKVKFKYCTRILSKKHEIETVYKEMILSPYALTWQDDHYYLIGNYEKYDNLIHLRVDRMKNVEITDSKRRNFSEVSPYTDSFDTADYVNKLFSMYGGELKKIELRCNKKIIEQVIDRFSDKIFIRNVTDGTFTFSIDAAVSEALVTWIINYGNDIEVISPAELREKILERAKKVTEIYKIEKND